MHHLHGVDPIICFADDLICNCQYLLNGGPPIKAAIVTFALLGFCSMVMAQEGAAKTQEQQVPVEQYT